LLGGLVGIVRENLRNRVGELVLARIRLLAERFDLLELFSAEFVDFVVEGQDILIVRQKMNSDYKQPGQNLMFAVAEGAPTWQEDIAVKGFAVIRGVFSSEEAGALLQALMSCGARGSRAGVRHALGLAPVAAMAKDPRLMQIACTMLGPRAVPFRATLFNKTPTSNWLVAWHQDRALPLQERRDVLGWGPWSVKDGVTYAHAPTRTLERVLALRVHLDDSTSRNGPLRVLPGAHTLGVLSDDSIHQVAAEISPVDCCVERGGVVAMKPLIVHSSSKLEIDAKRRVLHIEYAATLDVAEGLELRPV
jgi:hypothetical protein